MYWIHRALQVSKHAHAAVKRLQGVNLMSYWVVALTKFTRWIVLTVATTSVIESFALSVKPASRKI